MATFPSYKPTYSATKSSQPNVRTVQFGDGYQQRLTYGLNQNPKEWRLSFNVTDADADIIETFLNARAADNASFDWTMVQGKFGAISFPPEVAYQSSQFFENINILNTAAEAGR